MDNDHSQEDFRKFWEHIPWASQNEMLIILKGHLLVEDILREYCASEVKFPAELEKAKLTFTQVAQLVRAIQKYPPPQWVWGAIFKLNALRNKLAHKLIPEDFEKQKQEFVNLVGVEDEGGLFAAFPRDFEQVAVAIFMTYTALSINLRFKPQGLLAATLLAGASASSEPVRMGGDQ